MITLPKSELDKLEREFSKFSKEKIAAINKEVDRTAYAIETRSKNWCPVNTGRLRSSLHTVTLKGVSSFPSVVEGVKADALPFTAVAGQSYVGTTVHYAEDVEESYVKTQNGRQPFFSPAVEIEEKKFIANIQNILND
jgi:hypothetical protein